jgi:hypothetical protein
MQSGRCKNSDAPVGAIIYLLATQVVLPAALFWQRESHHQSPRTSTTTIVADYNSIDAPGVEVTMSPVRTEVHGLRS